MDEPVNTDSSKIVAICYAKRTPPVEQIHIAAGRSLIPRHGAEQRFLNELRLQLSAGETTATAVSSICPGTVFSS
jgi:hypothetical protein